MRRGLLLLFAGLLTGCPGPTPGVDLLPADYADTYTEVRDCRSSGDHDLHNIRVLADPAALGPYLNRMDPFPVGSIIVKEEYDFGDSDCSGEILRWTIMQRLEEGESPPDLDWHWQDVNQDFFVTEDNSERCAQCHFDCGAATTSYMGTCTDP